jgi:hypothetical protein
MRSDLEELSKIPPVAVAAVSRLERPETKKTDCPQDKLHVSLPMNVP